MALLHHFASLMPLYTTLDLLTYLMAHVFCTTSYGCLLNVYVVVGECCSREGVDR